MSGLGKEPALPEKYVFITFQMFFNHCLKTPGEELHEDSLFNHGDVLSVKHVSPRARNLLQTPVQQGKHPGHSLELCIPEHGQKVEMMVTLGGWQEYALP